MTGRNNGAIGLAFVGLGMVLAFQASAQSTSNMAALRGLAPVSVLPNTSAGKAALAANYDVTGGIQAGSLKQPALLPFALQQQQALRDAFITSGNATELADGLGTKLGTAYQTLAHYENARTFTSVSPAVADLLAYTNETTASDSNFGKYFFANGTADGRTPVAETVTALLVSLGGVTDVFGKAYNRVAGSTNADLYGNSRPFQTETNLTLIDGQDFFGAPSSSMAYLRGPSQDLTDSPSFPSGHATYGYMEAVLLAVLLPDRYQQQITRAAEYGNDRIILGAHYAMDVIAGRTLALHDVAHLLANDPDYVGQPRHRAVVLSDYQAALKSARADLVAALQISCGDKVALCATNDSSRFNDPAANENFYNATQTYDLPVVYPDMAGKVEDVGRIAPEAGYLLTAAFPNLTLDQANDILTSTEGPGGGFLDNGSAFGLYSRLNLYAAAKKAAALAPAK